MFIKLHNSQDGSVVLVNTRLIFSFTNLTSRSPNSPHNTDLSCVNNIHITVSETVAEITTLLDRFNNLIVDRLP